MAKVHSHPRDYNLTSWRDNSCQKSDTQVILEWYRYLGLQPDILREQQSSRFQSEAVGRLQMPWWSTVCHPDGKEQGILEGTDTLLFEGIKSWRMYSHSGLGRNGVVPWGTVMYRDSFQMRDASGVLEGGKKLRTVQKLWKQVICCL